MGGDLLTNSLQNVNIIYFGMADREFGTVSDSAHSFLRIRQVLEVLHRPEYLNIVPKIHLVNDNLRVV